MIPFSSSDALLLLAKTPGTLRHWLADLPDNWLQANEGGDTFSPFEVVRHLIHADRAVWAVRTRHILQHGENRPFDPTDSRGHRAETTDKTIGQLLDEFEAERAANLRFLRETNLSDAQLDRTGIHPHLGQVTLRNLLATWAAHDMAHIAQIARVMAKQYKTDIGPWVEFLSIMHDRENEKG